MKVDVGVIVLVFVGVSVGVFVGVLVGVKVGVYVGVTVGGGRVSCRWIKISCAPLVSPVTRFVA